MVQNGKDYDGHKGGTENLVTAGKRSGSNLNKRVAILAWHGFFPESKRFRKGADLTYTVVNHSEHVHELSVSLNPGEAFIVAGITKRVLELLPCSELTLSFHMIPTQTGNIKLPQLTMQAGVGEPYEGHGASLQELLDLSLPGRRSCFVRPRPLDEA